MTLEEFFARLAQDNAETPDLHTIRAGVSAVNRDDWQRQHPDVRLPDDLWAFLARSNGVAMYHEHVDGGPIYDEQRGGLGIYPLADFQPAELDMYGELRDEPETRRWFSIGSGLDGNLFIVFDLDTRHFLYTGPICPDEAVDVGPHIDQILDVLITAETP